MSSALAQPLTVQAKTTELINFLYNVVILGRVFLRRLVNLSIGLTKPYQHVIISS